MNRDVQVQNQREDKACQDAGLPTLSQEQKIMAEIEGSKEVAEYVAQLHWNHPISALWQKITGGEDCVAAEVHQAILERVRSVLAEQEVTKQRVPGEIWNELVSAEFTWKDLGDPCVYPLDLVKGLANAIETAQHGAAMYNYDIAFALGYEREGLTATVAVPEGEYCGPRVEIKCGEKQVSYVVRPLSDLVKTALGEIQSGVELPKSELERSVLAAIESSREVTRHIETLGPGHLWARAARREAAAELRRDIKQRVMAALAEEEATRGRIPAEIWKELASAEFSGEEADDFGRYPIAARGLDDAIETGIYCGSRSNYDISMASLDLVYEREKLSAKVAAWNNGWGYSRPTITINYDEVEISYTQAPLKDYVEIALSEIKNNMTGKQAE